MSSSRFRLQVGRSAYSTGRPSARHRSTPVQGVVRRACEDPRRQVGSWGLVTDVVTTGVPPGRPLRGRLDRDGHGGRFSGAEESGVTRLGRVRSGTPLLRVPVSSPLVTVPGEVPDGLNLLRCVSTSDLPKDVPHLVLGRDPPRFTYLCPVSVLLARTQGPPRREQRRTVAATSYWASKPSTWTTRRPVVRRLPDKISLLVDLIYSDPNPVSRPPSLTPFTGPPS